MTLTSIYSESASWSGSRRISVAGIKILNSGRVDSRDSAFPSTVQLPDGDIICSFSVGGGPDVRGGTDIARSRDGGTTWALEGAILPPTDDPYSTNALKLSTLRDGSTLFAYGSRSYRKPGEGFGKGRNEAVLCTSTDEGHTWSEPQVLPVPYDCPLEISYSAAVLSSNRLIAPAATLPRKDRLGEQVVVMISDDFGRSWPSHAVVFQDPNERFGYFEHKFTEISPGKVLSVCWTVTFDDVVDQPDSFVISEDNGSSWSVPRSTGIWGQTMTPISLGENRLLVLYNKRYGSQGIMMCLATFTREKWDVHFEDVMYDARAERQRPKDVETGVQEFDAFQFGFPTAIKLQDGSYLATHWCKESGSFGIRWTKLQIDW